MQWKIFFVLLLIMVKYYLVIFRFCYQLCEYKVKKKTLQMVDKVLKMYLHVECMWNCIVLHFGTVYEIDCIVFFFIFVVRCNFSNSFKHSLPLLTNI